MRSNYREKLGGYTVVLFFIIVALPAFAGAFSPDEGPPVQAPYSGRGLQPYLMSPPAFWRNPKIIEALIITEEQASKLNDADFTSREKKLALRAQLDGLHLQMEKAFSTSPANKNTVMELAQKIADLKGKLFLQEIDFKLTVEQMLTAEQLKKLKSDFPPCPPMDGEFQLHEKRFIAPERHP